MIGEKIGNVDLVKQLNGALVYRLIDQQGPISRIQIAELSGLAPASITKITRQLLERGLIKEIAQQASTGGRRAISLTIESTRFHAIAVKLGRNKIDIALVDLTGCVLAHYHAPFCYDSPSKLTIQLIKQLKFFIQQHEKTISELIAIAISLPGIVNCDNGVVEYMPNFKRQQLPLSELIKAEFNLECFIGNDTRGQALAEYYLGVSKTYQDSLLVSIDNGTGAGIIVNGKVFLGHRRNVGEIGHIQIDPLGAQCQCGNFGCLETFVSNPAILNQFNSLLETGHHSCLKNHPNIKIADICSAALKGDELAKQVLLNVGHHLGKAIAITVNLFNPEQIVISGAITQAKSIIFPAIGRCIKNQSLSAFHQDLPIVEAALSHLPSMSAFALVKRALLSGVLLQRLLDE